jgi:hypothetical protein
MTEARAARVLPSRHADLPLQVGGGIPDTVLSAPPVRLADGIDSADAALQASVDAVIRRLRVHIGL